MTSRRRSDRDYPRTVAEVLDDSAKYRPACLAALRAFKAARPWRGSEGERAAKFRTLHAELCRAYGLDVGLAIRPGAIDCYRPALRVIVLGSLSVVTYLHEFGHALRGRSERAACRWSINLFRRVFPRQYARCRHVGHTLRAPTAAERTLDRLHYPRPAGGITEDYRRHGYTVSEPTVHDVPGRPDA